MGTYKARGPDVFWKKMEDCIPLYSNPIVTWKFLIAFHRILQDGDATVVNKSMKHGGFIGKMYTDPKSHFIIGFCFNESHKKELKILRYCIMHGHT